VPGLIGPRSIRKSITEGTPLRAILRNLALTAFGLVFVAGFLTWVLAFLGVRPFADWFSYAFGSILVATFVYALVVVAAFSIRAGVFPRARSADEALEGRDQVAQWLAGLAIWSTVVAIVVLKTLQRGWDEALWPWIFWVPAAMWTRLLGDNQNSEGLTRTVALMYWFLASFTTLRYLYSHPWLAQGSAIGWAHWAPGVMFLWLAALYLIDARGRAKRPA
jgi:hypothetical protein